MLNIYALDILTYNINVISKTYQTSVYMYHIT